MADGEVVFGIIGFILAAVLWGKLFLRVISIDGRLVRGGGTVTMLATLTAIGAIVLAVLKTLSASDVRSHGGYIAMYLALGYAATALNLFALRAIGWRVSDMTERRNNAAAILLFSGSVASALAYAGANIGDGPGFHVVLVCAGIAHVALYALVALHIAGARTSYRILVDRDLGCALRFGCVLVAAGLLLGRAVAGTWVSLDATMHDFARIAWVPAVLFMVDIPVTRMLNGLDSHARLAASAFVGAVYLIGSGACVLWLGIPS